MPRTKELAIHSKNHPPGMVGAEPRGGWIPIQEDRVTKSTRALAALLIVGLVAGLASAQALAQVRAGYEIPYAAESPHPYPTGTGTTPAWTLQVEHPDATYIAIHFDRFDLAPGDRLVIRSLSGRQRHVLTERGRHGLGTARPSESETDARHRLANLTAEPQRMDDVGFRASVQAGSAWSHFRPKYVARRRYECRRT